MVLKNEICTIILDKNELTHDHCLISYKKFYENNKLSKEPIVKLLCNHCFYFENIKNSYAITNKLRTNYIKKRACPYCMKNGGYLPILDNKPVKDINLLLTNNKKFKLLCNGIIKNGINKGNKCNYKANLQNSKFIIKKIKKNIDNNIITTIIKKKVYYCGKHKPC